MKKFAIIAALLFVAAPAMAATTVIDIGWNGLTGNFDGAASYTTSQEAFTSGTVTRVLPPIGVAFFGPGYANGMSISLTISAITPTTAHGVGTFIITDPDGDTITGNVVGDWTKTGTSADFAGTAGNILYTDNGAVDVAFDGDTAGSASMVGLAGPLSATTFRITSDIGSSWFNTGAFTDPVENVAIKIIPAPGAVLLGMLGFGLVGYIRRRVA